MVKCEAFQNFVDKVVEYFPTGVEEAHLVVTSAANRLIGEVVQSRRRPLLALSHLRHY